MKPANIKLLIITVLSVLFIMGCGKQNAVWVGTPDVEPVKKPSGGSDFAPDDGFDNEIEDIDTGDMVYDFFAENNEWSGTLEGAEDCTQYELIIDPDTKGATIVRYEDDDLETICEESTIEYELEIEDDVVYFATAGGLYNIKFDLKNKTLSVEENIKDDINEEDSSVQDEEAEVESSDDEPDVVFDTSPTETNYNAMYEELKGKIGADLSEKTKIEYSKIDLQQIIKANGNGPKSNNRYFGIQQSKFSKDQGFSLKPMLK